MLRNVAIGLGAVLFVFVVVIVTRPSTFHIERSTTALAPPEAVYAQVSDFRAWTRWSPYEKLDPQMSRTYEGASYAWKSEGKAGEGKMTIEETEAPRRIAIRLEFVKPMAATNKVTFTFVPTAEGIKVTWAMDGENSVVGKAASLFMNIDKLVGDDFERGLASLKNVAENAPHAANP
jgi:uncharacterized protein YndB with AHSA1/START domain